MAASEQTLSGSFVVARREDGAVAFSGQIGQDRGAWGAFAHHYVLDFRGLTTPGRYTLRLPKGNASPAFTVGDTVYNGLVELSRRFFAVQRSGNTDPVGHEPSHLGDAPLSTDPQQYRRVTGGWYEAGDYLKFTRLQTAPGISRTRMETAAPFPP